MAGAGDAIEVLISRHGSAWRVYAHGWVAPYVRSRLDADREALVAAAPDLADLDRYMWGLDAPYTKRSTSAGGVALEARGRSAIMLWEWLDGYIRDAR